MLCRLPSWDLRHGKEVVFSVRRRHIQMMGCLTTVTHHDSCRHHYCHHHHHYWILLCIFYVMDPLLRMVCGLSHFILMGLWGRRCFYSLLNTLSWKRKEPDQLPPGVLLGLIDERTQFWRGAVICLESIHVELGIISRILILSFIHLGSHSGFPGRQAPSYISVENLNSLRLPSQLKTIILVELSSEVLLLFSRTETASLSR